MATRIEIDTAERQVLRKRMHERRWLLAASVIVLWGLLLTYKAKTRPFTDTRTLIAEKEIINLGDLESSRDLISVFATIYPDAEDREAAATHTYARVLDRRASSLFTQSLPNVGQLNTTAFMIPALKAEAGGAVFQERLAESRVRLGMDAGGMPLLPDTATAKPLAADGPRHVSGCVVSKNGMPMPGVTVVLRGTRAGQTETAADGCYRFDGLTDGDTVAVRPVRRYYAFTEQAVIFGGVDQERHFKAREHQVSLVGGAAALQRLKPKLIVRSPGVYARTFWVLVLIYLASIYGVHVFWFRRRFRGDAVLLPIVHLLTGLSLMLMFSLPDPLRDIMRAQGFVVGVAVGCLALGFVSQIDFQHKLWRRNPFLWLGLGVGAAALLYVYGAGPTGSDAKVNLVVPLIGSVQPVELIKLCLVLFLAGYFARNWTFLRELRQRSGLPRFMKKVEVPRYRDLLPVLGGIGVALATFYLLKDMGPALVVGCTFLVLYGIVRNRWLAVGMGLVVLIVGFWFIYRFQAVPMVAGRIQMLLSPWDNFVIGGEHLAHAYWAMATGGATGQGLGIGSPNYIPTAHTDMILPALGEELGLLGLLAIFALYAVLLYRALQIALRAGGMYSLFLGLSVALVLLFQILLIGGGAFGLMPLSGVVTPFLSFGKSSMAVNGILVGMLLSISARPGTAEQDGVQQLGFGRSVRYLMAVTVVLMGVIVLKAGYVQAVMADDWSIKPALMLRGSGERAYTYNPRIHDARRSITRGAIYDRNGIPLASSRWDELEAFHEVYTPLGVDLDELDRTHRRYYPFGALTFYLLGDVHTRVKWGATNSLYAEHAYLSHLRGYNNYPQPVEKKRTPRGQTEPIVRYNYAELLPLVRHGAESVRSRSLLQRNRDLHLTIDARLQHRVAKIMKALVPEGKTASVVILDAALGDVLASVTFPLPEAAFTDPTTAHRDEDLFDRGYGHGAKPPGSVSKLITSIAALNKTPEAAAWTYDVRASDRYARRGEPTGRVTMKRAIVGSSNVYFAALAREVVGADSLLLALETFGFRVGGASLSRRERVALLNEPDNVRQTGFGQGPVTASPLQVARLAATIANRGLRPDIRWVKGPDRPFSPGEYVFLPHHAQTLAGFMRGVVTDREGTAKSLRSAVVPIAGKTGTAEEVQYIERNGRRVRTLANHAWFAGFAPYEAPEADGGIPKIAIAVLVEDGGSGGRVAAPLAGAIVEAAVELGLIEGPPSAQPPPATEPPGTATPSDDSAVSIRWISN